MKATWLIPLSLFSTQYGFASAVRTTLHESVDLVYEKPFTITIESNTPLHVGFEAINFDCAEICIEMQRIYPDGNESRTGTQHGMITRYEPIDGKIEVTFHYLKPGIKPVKIYKERQVCDSEACAVLKEHNINYPYDYGQVDFDWGRVVIKSLDSLETSQDGSYTRVAGETVFGTKFDVFLISWLIEPDSGSRCPRHIEQRADAYRKTGKGYSFSGSFISLTDKPNPTPVIVDLGCGYWDYEKKEQGFL